MGVLDIKDDVLVQKFMAGVANMAAFSREVGIPTAAGLPHAFGNAFKNVAALVGEIDFEFKEVEEVKKFFADPEAYAAANPGGGGVEELLLVAAVRLHHRRSRKLPWWRKKKRKM